MRLYAAQSWFISVLSWQLYAIDHVRNVDEDQPTSQGHIEVAYESIADTDGPVKSSMS
jgi:hypothetical protein